MIEKAFDTMVKRARRCIAVGGGEHFIMNKIDLNIIFKSLNSFSFPILFSTEKK